MCMIAMAGLLFICICRTVFTAAVLLKSRVGNKAERKRRERKAKEKRNEKKEKRRKRRKKMSGEGKKVLHFAASGKMTEEEYINELKRQIREESRSIEPTTILDEWLKKVSLEKYEDPKKILQVVKQLNRHRQDEETPPEKKKQSSDDEAASDPSSSSGDSDDDKDEEAKASGSRKPEEDAEKRKDELKRLLQIKADGTIAEQLQQQEADPQAQQMEKREGELLALQEKAKARRRNLAKEAVKSQASVPSESSGSSDESDKKVEKEAGKVEEHKATEVPEEPKEAERAEESKEVEKPEGSKGPEMEPEEDEDFEFSIAEACREAYRMIDNSIESLL